MRKVLILLLGMLLFSGCLAETASGPESSDTTTGAVLEGPPKVGDVVKINYIMRVEGELVDTTFEELVNASLDSELIPSYHPFGFEPLTFVVGSGHVNPEFSKAVIDMRLGEKRSIILSPDDSTGIKRRDELVQTMPKFFEVPREETIPTSLFQTVYGVEPAVGKEIALQYWNSTIVEMTNESTVLRHNPVMGSNFESPLGNITIFFDESTVKTEFVPKINVTSQTSDRRYVTILSSNGSHIVVDYNHPLAGKTLDVEFVLEEISGPLEWLEDPEDSLSLSTQTGKPVLMLFTNTSCVTCRRIELETLTHPDALALKEQFVFVKIDTEIQKEVAEKYGASELPLVLILKDGKEKRRITTFLPPQAMRVEMESVLAST